MCWTIMSWFPPVSRADHVDEAAEALAREHAEAAARAREETDRETRAGDVMYMNAETDPPKRPLPNYSGREGNPKTFKEGFLWVPRTLFFPLYFLTEFLGRRGLGVVTAKAEEKELPARVRDAFTFGPKHDYTVYPVFRVDLPLRATIGVKGRFRNIPADNTTLRFSGNFGGVRFVSGQVGIKWTPPDKKWRLEGEAGGARFEDLFYGIGSEADQDNQARYEVAGFEVRTKYEIDPWRRGGIAFNTGYRYRAFGQGGSGTTIPQLVEEGKISGPPAAFPEGYSAWFLDTRITFDSRRPRPEPGSGVRLGAGFNIGVDPQRGDTSRAWTVYGAAVRGFLDVSGHNHTLSLGAIALFSDGLRGGVPFRELPVVSGNGPMPGFVGRFLTGDSAAVMNFQFTWPIWILLDGKVHFAVGNVFDGHLANFALEDLRMSFGGGLVAHGDEDIYFEFMVGGGSETFEQGARVTSFRVLFGVTRDF
jgi:hypothetical protein